MNATKIHDAKQILAIMTSHQLTIEDLCAVSAVEDARDRLADAVKQGDLEEADCDPIAFAIDMRWENETAIECFASDVVDTINELFAK